MRIDVPPLRERQEDIQLLAEHFLLKYSTEMARPTPRLSEAARQSLQSYAWPGNVRELENLMERAAVLCRGQSVEPQLLPINDSPTPSTTPAGEQTTFENLLMNDHVEALEKRLITTALERSGDNKSAAARLLGVSERTLWYKLKKYEL